MVQCDRCLKVFKYPCYLKRHTKNKVQCKIINKTENDTQITEKATQITENATQITENVTQITEKDTLHQFDCKYCYKNFSRKWDLNNHVKVCTYRHDNVVIYELELGIKRPDEKINECRFCNFKFASKKSYQKHCRNGCQKKKKYEKELEARALKARENIGCKQIINNTTNNNINNTININLPPIRAFGNENIDYVTSKIMLQELKKVRNVHDLSGLISNFTKIIHANPAHPENHNVQIQSLNGSFARIFNGNDFENKDVTAVQDSILNKIGDLVLDQCDNETKIHNEFKVNRIEDIRTTIDDEVIGDLGRTNDRNTRKYRHKVKEVLYNNKYAIVNTEKAKEIE